MFLTLLEELNVNVSLGFPFSFPGLSLILWGTLGYRVPHGGVKTGPVLCLGIACSASPLTALLPIRTAPSGLSPPLFLATI